MPTQTIEENPEGLPLVLQELTLDTKGNSVDTKGKQTTPISIVRGSTKISREGLGIEFSIPQVNLESLVHMPKQSLVHTAQTPEH